MNQPRLPLAAFADSLCQIHIPIIIVGAAAWWQRSNQLGGVARQLHVCATEAMVVQGVQVGLQLVLHELSPEKNWLVNDGEKLVKRIEVDSRLASLSLLANAVRFARTPLLKQWYVSNA